MPMTYACSVFSCPWRYQPDGMACCSYHKPKPQPKPAGPLFWRVFEVRNGYLVTPGFGVFWRQDMRIGGMERKALPAPPWVPGEWVTADCLEGHDAPADGCSCGIYAVQERDELTAWLAGMTRYADRDPVSMWFTFAVNRANAYSLMRCAIAPVELDGPLLPVPPEKEPPDPPSTRRAARARIPVGATVWEGRLTRPNPFIYGRRRPLAELLAPYQRRKATT